MNESTIIYKSRNFLKLLGTGIPRSSPVGIYKSRNFLKLLGRQNDEKKEQIYKSRNFLKFLGTF